jgi:hypothetical protein
MEIQWRQAGFVESIEFVEFVGFVGFAGFMEPVGFTEIATGRQVGPRKDKVESDW